MLHTDEQAVEHFLTRGVERLYPSPEVVRELFYSGKKLRMYHGIDPTGAQLHIGHAIQLRKLGEFQKLGHTTILLIGTFTAMIGDPSDKLATRVPLSAEQVRDNMKNYLTYAKQFLNFDGPNAVEVRYNDAWLAKLSLTDVITLMQQVTVQQMLERDMFQARISNGKPIHLHEFLYPLLQGYDSVFLDVDGELGGNDQTFNMLMGRTLARHVIGKEKFVIVTKLLTDPTGKKMGKTEGNMITLDDSAEEMYGKVMSWSDPMILPGYEVCTTLPDDIVAAVAAALTNGENPMTHKKRLAREVTALYHGTAGAAAAEAYFVATIQNKEIPESMEELRVVSGVLLSDPLLLSKLVASKGDFKRLVEEGAVMFENQKVDDFNFAVTESGVVKVGKRKFLRVIIQ